jgi:hypothetical protein
MKILQIHLPEDLEQQILSLTGNEAAFIMEAVAEKIAREKQNQLNKALIEGYQSTFEEDLNLAKKFEATDFEHWQ